MRGNSHYYYTIISSVITLSTLSSFSIGFIVFFISRGFYHTAIEEIPLILGVCLTVKGMALAITLPVTSLIGFQSYKRGMDPDIILYPVSSVLADVIATISYIITLSLVSWSALGRLTILSIGCFMTISVIVISILFRREGEYWKTIKEALPAIFTVALIESVSGGALSSIRKSIERYPSLLMVYPVLIGILGNLGSIFASRSTTKLALGAIKARFSSLKEEIGDLLQMEAAALLIYSLYGLLSFAIEGNGVLALIITLSHLPVFLVIAATAFALAIFTFVKGLDPDNFVIPFETTLADSLLTIALALQILFIMG